MKQEMEKLLMLHWILMREVRRRFSCKTLIYKSVIR